MAKKTKRSATSRSSSKPAKKAKAASRRSTKTANKTPKHATRKSTRKTTTKAVRKPTAKPKPKALASKVARQSTKAKSEADIKKTTAMLEAVKPVETPKDSSSTASGRKPKTKPAPTVMPDLGGGILGPGAPKRKPLIPSGSSAIKTPHLEERDASVERKSPLSLEQLERFREILVHKRAELAGDVANMEEEALRGGGSGSLSHIPQHMAEQGSEAYDQSLSLDLAAADRRLIKEIDDAIARIDAGTYGICEYTGKPIRLERLNELPWARYSIEAARELERRRLVP